jgi:site-specific DNA-methyltransferase (adenine-specific)
MKSTILSNGINAYLGDCMDLMRDKPDNYYDLAIVDPPYGIGVDKMGLGKGKKKTAHNNLYSDTPPVYEYFNLLKRVSKSQIIWGYNYFVNIYPMTGTCWVVWDKIQEFSGADFELAYTSFNSPSKAFRMSRVEAYGNGTIHPTQKPIALYRWLLKNYAKPNDKILDTHGGSFSSAIACQMEGFDLDICELDEDYFNDAVKRFKLNTVQEKLF